MQTPYRQQRRLWRIERTLSRSDPRLAAMLGIFAQLYADELLSSSEQEPGVRRRAWLLAAVIRLAGWLSACAAALSRVAGAAWRAARGRPRTAQRSGARAA
jgi:hypothetical protein